MPDEVKDLELTDEIKDILKKSDRYSDFILLDKPVVFCEFFKDKNFSVVQLHTISLYEANGVKDIVGFCGIVSWKDNKLVSLDHDSYYDDMKVYGYETFPRDGEDDGLDILVGNDW